MLIQDFPSGTLTLDIKNADIPSDQLFGFAERQNPNRAFLFVSKVLGRHIPSSPLAMRAIWRRLSAKIPVLPQYTTVFIGLAETAITLGAGVCREYSSLAGPTLFLADTRHSFARPELCRFLENHSHAREHILYAPENIARASKPLHVVAIDDEATTGETFANLQTALENSDQRIGKVTRVVITDWTGGKSGFCSLLSGSWAWSPKQPPESFPAPRPWVPKKVEISPRQDWGRFGAMRLDINPWPEIQIPRAARALVLGTGEFGWPPYLLAERLEKSGVKVGYGSTTRSPIKTGMAIRSKIEFEDNYGLGTANYLYNVNPAEWDHIFLCVETGRDSVSGELLGALKKAEILEY